MVATNPYCRLLLLGLSENLDGSVDSKFLQKDGQEKGSTASQIPYDSNEGGFRSSVEEVTLGIFGPEVVREYWKRQKMDVSCCVFGCRCRVN